MANVTVEIFLFWKNDKTGCTINNLTESAKKYLLGRKPFGRKRGLAESCLAKKKAKKKNILKN